MDFEAIKAAARGYQADMTRFLREMISHPSESCEEREVVHCIKAEMEHLGYDEVEVDGLGNEKRSSPSTLISTPSASATSPIGRPTPTRATKLRTSSTAGAAPIRRAAWPLPYTASRS